MRAIKQASRWVRLGYHLVAARLQSGIAHRYQYATVQQLEKVDKTRKRVERKMRLEDARQLEHASNRITESAGKHWKEAQRLAFKVNAPEPIKKIIHRHGVRLGKRNMATHYAVKEWAKSEI